MNTEELSELIDKQEEIHKKIMDNLPDDVTECHCDDPEHYSYIHNGNLFDEIMTVCINCGGMVV